MREKFHFQHLITYSSESNTLVLNIDMGQYWEFMNIDKRQGSGHLGNLGELFFTTRTSDSLIYLLAVPAIPLKLINTSSNGSVVAGAWAGDRIICLGDYAYTWPGGPRVNDAHFLQTASHVASPQTFSESCTNFRSVNCGYERQVSYPNDGVWALRNLSKKLYVRSDGIPTINDENNLTYEAHDGLQGFPNLGHALLANIVWSDDSSTSMRFRDVQGSWAGDRIDVRLMDDVAEEIQEGWKDISRQEAVTLYNIFVEEEEVDGDFPEEPKAPLE